MISATFSWFRGNQSKGGRARSGMWQNDGESKSQVLVVLFFYLFCKCGLFKLKWDRAMQLKSKYRERIVENWLVSDTQLQ